MPELPDPTRSELAALRAPDLTLAYDLTLGQCRAVEHVGGREIEVIGRALRYFAETALAEAGFEIIRELQQPPTERG